MLRCSEPSVTDLLADPMIRLIMRSDGVSEAELSGVAEAARARILEGRETPEPLPPPGAVDKACKAH